MSIGFELLPADNTGGDLRLLRRPRRTDDRRTWDRIRFDPLFSNALFGAFRAIFVAAGFDQIQLATATTGGERTDLPAALLMAQ